MEFTTGFVIGSHKKSLVRCQIISPVQSNKRIRHVSNSFVMDFAEGNCHSQDEDVHQYARMLLLLCGISWLSIFVSLHRLPHSAFSGTPPPTSFVITLPSINKVLPPNTTAI